MAEAITTTKRYAIVTGSNKGIGFEICRQLASKGIIVVLTARDEKKGFEALEKLKSDGLSDHVVFCQLDVVDPSSVASLADFIKSKFGRLDILVNNAGIHGAKMDWDSLQSSEGSVEEVLSSWKKIMTQSYELGNECLQTNYYGTKRMIEALNPLLQLSDSPRIVNVSSVAGKLKLMPSEWAKGVLNDVESLTEERIEEVLNEFLKDFKEGVLETKGWPTFWSAYAVSKAAINAYTRILAKKHPTFRINCVCPGWVKTDINNHIGKLTTEQGAQCPVKLALLPDDGPSGLFFTNNEPSSFV
ncbi:(+)-neomenthol dehydrogenase [Camellia lanceoleosa]|uniref:(+)-neomenthol dehydrogenase n=1 Tax=Camellia lanceoleosa TaxID=1840588 RepID=A0ACC0ID80_9ERIC|nr:(+)-neomenthol dehydrogenase [Camellia lanceoleosa]